MFNKILTDLKSFDARLVAVSKTKPEKQILELYKKGQLIFGENRVQEVVQKAESLPKDIKWHFIGHLQSKKVKYIAPFVHTIHAVDSIKLLKEINKQAQKHNRNINCFLQFKIAQEETKFGLNIEDGRSLLESLNEQTLSNISISGVMGMATFTENKNQVREEFHKLKSIFDQLKKDFFTNNTAFREISMGMSGDYKIALEEGSTMVRIGSLLFGAR